MQLLLINYQYLKDVEITVKCRHGAIVWFKQCVSHQTLGDGGSHSEDAGQDKTKTKTRQRQDKTQTQTQTQTKTKTKTNTKTKTR
jgi:hypothetical protein